MSAAFRFALSGRKAFFWYRVKELRFLWYRLFMVPFMVPFIYGTGLKNDSNHRIYNTFCWQTIFPDADALNKVWL